MSLAIFAALQVSLRHQAAQSLPRNKRNCLLSYHHGRSRFALTAIAAGWLLGCSSAALAQATLIKDVRVFDGEQTHEQRSVLIDGNRIVEDDFQGEDPADARIVTCEDCTLLPGFFDAHVHAYAGIDDALLFGVTTMLDMFTLPAATQQSRARTAAHDNRGEADLHSAGILATAPGGHGTQFGIEVPTITAAEEAPAWVSARIAEGSDYIKIIVEGGGEEIGRALPTLNQQTVTALVEAAHSHGKLAVVHTQNSDAARIAVKAGADGLVHFFADEPVDDALLTAMREQNIFVSPTYAVFESFAGRAGSAALMEGPAFQGLLHRTTVASLQPSAQSDRIETFAPAMEANIAALRDAGITILAGSDSPNPGTWFGVSLHRELELLVQSGLSPQEALIAATSAPADAYRIKDHGRIADGAFADLLLVRGDPTQDITATQAIVEVWKDGQSVAQLRSARRKTVTASASASAQAQPLPEGGSIASFTNTGDAVSIEAPFGSWSVSTDAIMGGASTAQASVTGDSTLRLSGNVSPGGFGQWAGIAWMPGDGMMVPANLASAVGISFRIRGIGAGPGVMGFSEAGGQRPSIAGIEIGEEWREVTVAFADLPRFDKTGTTMLLIGIFEPGDYAIELDRVRLLTE